MARHLRTKPRTFPFSILFACNGGLQDILAANQPDGPVIHLDGVDDRAEVTHPGVDVRGIEFFVHQTRECVDLPGIDSGCGAALGACMVQRRFGAFPLGFQGGGSFLQDVVQFDDAVFDRAVKRFRRSSVSLSSRCRSSSLRSADSLFDA